MEENLMKLLILPNGTLRNISYWGLHLIKSKEVFGGKIKDSNIIKVDFPEENGSMLYIAPNPKEDSFDYSVTFGFVPKEGEKTSIKMKAFWNEIKGREVEIQNLYKGVALRAYALEMKDGSFYPESNVFLFDVVFFCKSGITTPIV